MVVALSVQIAVATRPVCGDGKYVLKSQRRRTICDRAGQGFEYPVDRLSGIGKRGRWPCVVGKAPGYRLEVLLVPIVGEERGGSLSGCERGGGETVGKLNGDTQRRAVGDTV